MQQVCVCRFCGKTIESQYLYCPWCGELLHESTHLAEIVNQVFDSVEEKETGKRIEKIGQTLDILEKEITLVIHTMESKK
ncbi:MAG TPA: hypothetical protein PLG87_02380 [Treponemataceae bacterium]|jgi:uncharacterized C2H2 Zn-finger protein|nr:hypothetical protein [Treponemataceae bacterium]